MGRMNVRRSCCLLAAMACLLLGGCALPWDATTAGPVPMPEEFSRAESESTEGAAVDVYWDATYSMQGYTTLAADNVYRALPDRLGDLGDAIGTVQFFRFGAEVAPLDGREYRKFSSPAAYDELITAVHNVVDNADPGHLSIIVTDLFESESDWSNVTKKLKDKYFARHMAVAVIGIKNPFYGEIFDVGLGAAKFHYNSGNNPALYRPFYLFLMGPEARVREFLGLWRERQTASNEMQYLLFSEHLTESALDFSRLALLEDSRNLYENETLGIRDKGVKEFGISDAGDPVVLSARFDYQPLFGACPVDMDALHASVEVLSLGEDGLWEPVGRMGDAAVEIAGIPDQPEAYHVVLRFTPERTLSPDRVNFIHAAVAPEPGGCRLPDWVREWDMPNADAGQFDGSKTANLLPIMESLKSSAMAASPPSLLNMNLVIDER